MASILETSSAVALPAGRRARSSFLRLGKRHGPIGFELSHEKLHMLQMTYGKQGPRIRAAVSIRYPMDRARLLESPRDLRRLVARGLAEKPFIGKRVVTCLPAEDVKLMLVQYKMAANASEPEVVLRQAMERLDGQAVEWVVDYLPVEARGDTQGERTALVACARREQVAAYLDLLHALGFEVEALEIGPMAIQRLVTSVSDLTEDENVLTLNFGRDRSFLTVFSGGRLNLDREVSFGETEIADKLGKSLDVSREEARQLLYRYGVSALRSEAALGDDGSRSREISQTIGEIVKPRFLELAEEVSKAVIYTASQTRGASIDRVYLLGSVARWPGAERLLNGLFSLPVLVLDPFAAFLTRSDAAVVQDLDPIAGIAIATGCALRQPG